MKPETRRQKYAEVLSKAMTLILSELEEKGFDTDEITVNIKLENHEFNETFGN